MASLVSRSGEVHGRGVDLFIISILFCFIAVCLVVVRVFSRGTLGKKLGSDDIVIIFSMVCSLCRDSGRLLCRFYPIWLTRRSLSSSRLRFLSRTASVSLDRFIKLESMPCLISITLTLAQAWITAMARSSRPSNLEIFRLHCR